MRTLRIPRLAVLTWPILLGVGLTLAAFVVLGWAAPGEVRALTALPQPDLAIVAPSSHTAAPVGSQPQASGVFSRVLPTRETFPETSAIYGGGGILQGGQAAPFLAAGEDLTLSPPMPGLAESVGYVRGVLAAI